MWKFGMVSRPPPATTRPMLLTRAKLVWALFGRYVVSRRGVAMWKALFLLAIGFLVTSAAKPADTYLYRWRDAWGVLNYSDIPPREGAREVKILRVPSQT